MKGLAFIKDPDGYWIEILSPNNEVTTADWIIILNNFYEKQWQAYMYTYNININNNFGAIDNQLNIENIHTIIIYTRASV